MTERRRRPGPLGVIAAAVATFLTVLTLLAVQLQAGHDPALGSGGAVASLTAGQHNGTRVVTRASGAAPAAQPSGAVSAPRPVITRASGASGEVEDD